MLLALWIALAAPIAGNERTVMVDGKPLALPASASAAGVALPINL